MTTVSGHLAAGLPPLDVGHPAVSRPVGGFRLAYDRCGSGPGVVLLHGWPGDRTDYTDVAVRVDGDVVVPDLRGIGESDRHPGGDLSVPGQAASVLGLVDELRLGRVVLAGYGIGSLVAQHLAARHPDRVAGIVVTPAPPAVPAPAPGPVPDVLVRAWGRWSGPGFTPSTARLEHLAGQYGCSPVPVLPPCPPPGRVTVPAIVLWPEHDPLVPPAWCHRLGERFSQVSIRALPGVGHFAPVEEPAAFVEAVHELLARRWSR